MNKEGELHGSIFVQLFNHAFSHGKVPRIPYGNELSKGDDMRELNSNTDCETLSIVRIVIKGLDAGNS